MTVLRFQTGGGGWGGERDRERGTDRDRQTTETDRQTETETERESRHLRFPFGEILRVVPDRFAKTKITIQYNISCCPNCARTSPILCSSTDMFSRRKQAGRERE